MPDTLFSIVTLFGLGLALCALCYALISSLAQEFKAHSTQSKENIERVTPDTFFKIAVEYLRDNFYDQTKADALADWLQAFERPLVTFSQAAEAINKALALLGDEYTVFREVRSEVAEPVHSAKLADRLAYIRISSFRSKQCAKSVYEQMLRLSGSSAYIIDLRGNGGGLLRQALETFALFANEGSFAIERMRINGHSNTGVAKLTLDGLHLAHDHSRLARYPNLLQGKPLAVLIDQNSASCSETLARALRKLPNTVLIGAPTRGKGSVQLVQRIGSVSEVAVTSGYIYDEKGNSLHHQRVIPDIWIKANFWNAEIIAAFQWARSRTINYQNWLGLSVLYCRLWMLAVYFSCLKIA